MTIHPLCRSISIELIMNLIFSLTVSFGIASETPAATDTPEDFVKRAGLALIEAKRAGGDAVQIYGERQSDPLQETTLAQSLYSG